CVAPKQAESNAITASYEGPPSAIVDEARRARPGHRRPLKPGKAGSSKRIGNEADRAGLAFSQQIDGILARHICECLARAPRDPAAHLAAPPAQPVHVMDAAVDQRAAAGALGEPPTGVPTPAAGDEMDFAHIAEPPGVQRLADPAEGRHEPEVLRSHQ